MWGGRGGRRVIGEGRIRWGGRRVIGEVRIRWEGRGGWGRIRNDEEEG